MGKLEKHEKLVLDRSAISRILNRISHQVVEELQGADDLVVIGIRTCGVYLAKRIAGIISGIENHEVPMGMLDITLYRDDLSSRIATPIIKKTEINFSVDGKRIVLVDDILYTGRTIRAALNAIIDFGRPESIKLAVLADRGHRELPIHADFTGIDIETTEHESLKLYMGEGIDDERLVRFSPEKHGGSLNGAG